MSLLELKLTVLKDCLKKNEEKWRSEYIDANWPISELLKTKGKMRMLYQRDKLLTSLKGFIGAIKAI